MRSVLCGASDRSAKHRTKRTILIPEPLTWEYKLECDDMPKRTHMHRDNV